MTHLILQLREGARRRQMALRAGGLERLAFVAILFAAAMVLPGVRPVVLEALADAYLGVGVFVAATFALFFWLEQRLGIDAGTWLERQKHWEIPAAAILGALPGCGGAVMVITQFAMGRATFGAVVAVLTSTMGDAAFLLLAQEPVTGLILIAVGFVVGSLSGYLVNAIHSPDFLRVTRPRLTVPTGTGTAVPQTLWRFWAAITAPGLVLGIAGLFQLDVPMLLYLTIGAGGCVLSVALWAVSPAQAVHMASEPGGDTLIRRVALNTNFVTVWVVLAFLAFEFMGGDRTLSPLFNSAPAVLLPLVGIVVGFLPGCGPQILVTTLYLAGLLPLSAQLGNAISNDGDALFPAIAVAPKAAIIATLYTAVPAVLVAYGFYYLVENAP